MRALISSGLRSCGALVSAWVSSFILTLVYCFGLALEADCMPPYCSHGNFAGSFKKNVPITVLFAAMSSSDKKLREIR